MMWFEAVYRVLSKDIETVNTRLQKILGQESEGRCNDVLGGDDYIVRGPGDDEIILMWNVDNYDDEAIFEDVGKDSLVLRVSIQSEDRLALIDAERSLFERVDKVVGEQKSNEREF